jgi:hypothetical protein
MTTKHCRAAIPFSKAQEYINVNAFGSNIVVRIAGDYREIDVLGRNVPLPGVVKQMKSRNSKTVIDQSFDDDELLISGQTCIDTTPRSSSSANSEMLQRHRTKVKIRELRLLLNQNFDPNQAQLVTATFNDRNIEFQDAANCFQKFRKELQRKAPGTKYLSVIEPDERAGFHLHMVIDKKLPLTPFEANEYIKDGTIKSRAGALTALWTHGNIHQKPLNGGGNLGATLGRYLSKKAKSPEMRFKYSINKSSNLTPYSTLRGIDALEFIQQGIIETNLNEIYSYTCTGLEHIDYLHHYEFCLNPERVLLYGPKVQQVEGMLEPVA